MARQLIGLDEPFEGKPSPEIAIRITVPEEFMGVAVGELYAREGFATGMDSRDGVAIIGAALLSSEFEAFSEAITYNTQGRGRVERELPQAEI